MKKTKQLFKTEITKYLLKNGTNEVLSEAAFPAYAHKNIFIDYVFWKRLKVVSNYILKKGKVLRILDFGCGSGVMSYNLALQNHKIIAIDLDLTPINLLKSNISYPKSIEFFEGSIFDRNLETKSFDIIIALDVLEHMDKETLKKYINKFDELLKKDGELIVSGPTENLLYKVGRKIAGKNFTGIYHHSEINSIKKVFSINYNILRLKKIFLLLPLFEIFVAKKRT